MSFELFSAVAEKNSSTLTDHSDSYTLTGIKGAWKINSVFNESELYSEMAKLVRAEFKSFFIDAEKRPRIYRYDDNCYVTVSKIESPKKISREARLAWQEIDKWMQQPDQHKACQHTQSEYKGSNELSMNDMFDEVEDSKDDIYSPDIEFLYTVPYYEKSEESFNEQKYFAHLNKFLLSIVSLPKELSQKYWPMFDYNKVFKEVSYGDHKKLRYHIYSQPTNGVVSYLAGEYAKCQVLHAELSTEQFREQVDVNFSLLRDINELIDIVHNLRYSNLAHFNEPVYVALQESWQDMMEDEFEPKAIQQMGAKFIEFYRHVQTLEEMLSGFFDALPKKYLERYGCFDELRSLFSHNYFIASTYDRFFTIDPEYHFDKRQLATFVQTYDLLRSDLDCFISMHKNHYDEMTIRNRIRKIRAKVFAYVPNLTAHFCHVWQPYSLDDMSLESCRQIEIYLLRFHQLIYKAQEINGHQQMLHAQSLDDVQNQLIFMLEQELAFIPRNYSKNRDIKAHWVGVFQALYSEKEIESALQSLKGVLSKKAVLLEIEDHKLAIRDGFEHLNNRCQYTHLADSAELIRPFFDSIFTHPHIPIFVLKEVATFINKYEPMQADVAKLKPADLALFMFKLTQNVVRNVKSRLRFSNSYEGELGSLAESLSSEAQKLTKYANLAEALDLFVVRLIKSKLSLEKNYVAVICDMLALLYSPELDETQEQALIQRSKIINAVDQLKLLVGKLAAVHDHSTIEYLHKHHWNALHIRNTLLFFNVEQSKTDLARLEQCIRIFSGLCCLDDNGIKMFERSDIKEARLLYDRYMQHVANAFCTSPEQVEEMTQLEEDIQHEVQSKLKIMNVLYNRIKLVSFRFNDQDKFINHVLNVSKGILVDALNYPGSVDKQKKLLYCGAKLEELNKVLAGSSYQNLVNKINELRQSKGEILAQQLIAQIQEIPITDRDKIVYNGGSKITLNDSSTSRFLVRILPQTGMPSSGSGSPSKDRLRNYTADLRNCLSPLFSDRVSPVLTSPQTIPEPSLEETQDQNCPELNEPQSSIGR